MYNLSRKRGTNRQPEKKEYQTLVLNDRPFGNALAVSFFRRRGRLHSRAYYFHCNIEKRSGKIGRDVSFNESHVLYSWNGSEMRHHLASVSQPLEFGKGYPIAVMAVKRRSSRNKTYSAKLANRKVSKAGIA